MLKTLKEKFSIRKIISSISKQKSTKKKKKTSFIVKLDRKGGKKWETNFIDDEETLSSFVVYDNKQILLTGQKSTQFNGRGDAWLVSLDYKGKQKWQESDGNKSLREIDTVSDQRSESPEKRSLKNDVIRLVTKGLSRPERMIMILYYYEQMTMKEIGATLDLSESRVSQMHSSIVERLQLQLADRQTEMAC